MCTLRSRRLAAHNRSCFDGVTGKSVLKRAIYLLHERRDDSLVHPIADQTGEMISEVIWI